MRLQLIGTMILINRYTENCVDDAPEMNNFLCWKVDSIIGIYIYIFVLENIFLIRRDGYNQIYGC